MSQRAKAFLHVLAVLLVCGGSAVIAEDAATKPTSDEHKEAIRPRVADKFGTVISVEGVFVPKSNSYHDQNMVNEPFLLKVLKVEGKELSAPVIIEYAAGKERVEEGIRYRMKAYETLYTEGVPVGWGEGMAQVNYYLVHQLRIKDLAKTP